MNRDSGVLVALARRRDHEEGRHPRRVRRQHILPDGRRACEEDMERPEERVVLVPACIACFSLLLGDLHEQQRPPESLNLASGLRSRDSIRWLGSMDVQHENPTTRQCVDAVLNASQTYSSRAIDSHALAAINTTLPDIYSVPCSGK